MSGTLRTADAFPAAPPTGGRGYHPHLAELRLYRASGAYAIVNQRGKVLYVGESHTGRLYDTITRHFRSWSIDAGRDAQGRRRGGTTYDRSKVRIVYLLTEPDEAQDLQYAQIQRLHPKDNTVDGSASEPAPF